MGEKKKSLLGDPSITNGKVKTTFRRVEGCTKLDRMIAHNNMKKAGITQINKKVNGISKFQEHWKDYVY